MFLLVFICYIVCPISCVFYTEMFRGSFWAWVAAVVMMSCHYIAVEIEQPFGDDINHLPLATLQSDFNRSLVTLLDARAQRVPHFDTGDKRLSKIRTLTVERFETDASVERDLCVSLAPALFGQEPRDVGEGEGPLHMFGSSSGQLSPVISQDSRSMPIHDEDRHRTSKQSGNDSERNL